MCAEPKNGRFRVKEASDRDGTLYEKCLAPPKMLKRGLRSADLRHLVAKNGKNAFFEAAGVSPSLSKVTTDTVMTSASAKRERWHW